jgi:hypothetical protein
MVAETPEGPMPGQEEGVVETPEGAVGKKKEKKVKYWADDYEDLVELVSMLRGIGVIMHAKCPVCEKEGTISVIKTKNGYKYLVFRHPETKQTHVVSRYKQILIERYVYPELCEVKKDLEYILKRFNELEKLGLKFCKEGQ